MKRLTGTNKEIAELLYQEQLELSKENRDVESTVQAIIEDVKKIVETRPFVTIQLNLIRLT